MQPRLIRLLDAPNYLGMDKNRFNREVKPLLSIIQIGKRGIAFDRLDLDAWVEHYKQCNGRPANKRSKRLWGEKERRGCLTVKGSGTSTKKYSDNEFAKVVDQILSKKPKSTSRNVLEIRQAKIYGVRPKRTFRQAAMKYLEESQHNASIKEDARWLNHLDSFIGHLPLESIHMTTLQDYIQKRKKEKVKMRTISYPLQVIRRILNLSAEEWKDEYGLSWLSSEPKIKLESETDKPKPYPLSPEEQIKLFNELPLHLRRMAIFAANIGCRDQEICSLKWEWETKIPEGSVFLIPDWRVKNREERLVVLNRIAHRVIEDVRGIHPEYVFTFRGEPVTRMLNSAWVRAQLSHVRVHDLKHTFERRLRAAEVSFEDRQDLLGHKSGRITTHYSAAELANLIRAASKACDSVNQLIVLKREQVNVAPAKVPRGNLRENLKVV